MLLTLVYRSHISDSVLPASLEEMVSRANIGNERNSITGNVTVSLKSIN